MRYRVRRMNGGDRFSNLPFLNFPVQVIPRVSYGKFAERPGGGGDVVGRISLSITARSISSLIFSSSRKGPLVVEDVTVIIPFPKFVRTANLNVTLGRVLYDEAGKIAKWTIGKLDEKTRPQLNGSMVLEEGGEETMASSHASGEEQPPLFVNWKILLASVSGLNVSGLSVTGEQYKPYKGVRNITKSGTFQIRCY